MNPATEKSLMSPPSPVQCADPKPTLLFVDDEERILRSLRMMFAANYRVLVTTNGHEALEILRREKVHALISDGISSFLIFLNYVFCFSINFF